MIIYIDFLYKLSKFEKFEFEKNPEREVNINGESVISRLHLENCHAL